MQRVISKLFPKQHSVSEAARLASCVYLSSKSKSPSFLKIREKMKSSLVKTNTSLCMRSYQDIDSPEYEVVAIRGTVGMEDCWNDNLPHTLGINGITEYQEDAYQALIEHMSQPYANLPIVLTGHSMGGKIADMLLAQFYVAYIKASPKQKSLALRRLTKIIAVYAFDSPGTYPLLLNFFQEAFPKQSIQALNAFLRYRESRIMDVVGQPNSANMTHRHAQYVYYLASYGCLPVKPLSELLLEDYTQALQEKHSIDDMADALIARKPLVKVMMWGGVSAIESESSIKRLNNFACSYHEHRERIAKQDPSIKNHTASYVSKFVLRRLSRSKIAQDHPLVFAAKDIEQGNQSWLAWAKKLIGA